MRPKGYFGVEENKLAIEKAWFPISRFYLNRAIFWASNQIKESKSIYQIFHAKIY